MGAGIASMHYLGIAGIRANCIVETTYWGAAAALIVGVVVSWFALRAMTTPTKKTAMQTLSGAVLMGVAISGMHYVAMADTRFISSDGVAIISEPVLSQYTLASLCRVFGVFALRSFYIYCVAGAKQVFSFFRASR